MGVLKAKCPDTRSGHRLLFDCWLLSRDGVEEQACCALSPPGNRHTLDEATVARSRRAIGVVVVCFAHCLAECPLLTVSPLTCGTLVELLPVGTAERENLFVADDPHEAESFIRVQFQRLRSGLFSPEHQDSSQKEADSFLCTFIHFNNKRISKL